MVTPDETGWRVGALRHWLWAFATPTTTVYAIRAGRGFDDAATVLGTDFSGVLVRDGWAPYRRFTEALHQTFTSISRRELLARVKNLTEAMTKTQLFSDIAEKTKLTRRQVADVFEALESVIERHVQKGAVGACTIPGLMKIKVVKKPAQRARKNVPNPFRPGETMDVKAKPASASVKVLSLKKLKEHGVGVRRTPTPSRGARGRCGARRGQPPGRKLQAALLMNAGDHRPPRRAAALG